MRKICLSWKMRKVYTRTLKAMRAPLAHTRRRRVVPPLGTWPRRRLGTSIRLLIIYVLALALSVHPALAGVDSTWIDNMFSVRAGSSSTDMGNYIYGGPSVTYSAPIKNLRPFSIAAPRMHIGNCGSDLFFGAFSMLKPEYYVNLAQGVISAAPAYAFNMGLQALCTTCYQIKSDIEHIVQKLNSINLNSCELTQRLMGSMMPEYLNRKGSTGALDGVAGAIKEKTELIAQQVDEMVDLISGKSSGDDEGPSGATPPEIAHYLFGYCLEVNGGCSGAGSLDILKDQVFSDFKVCTAEPNSPRCTDNFAADVPDYVSEMFGSVTNYLTFAQYFVGKLTIQYDMSKKGDCDPSSITNCFTDWIAGSSTCGDCKGTQVLSYKLDDDNKPRVVLPEVSPADDSKLKSGFKINDKEFTLDKLIHSSTPELGDISLNICISGNNEFQGCGGNLTSTIEDALESLLTNSTFEKKARDTNGTASGPTSPGFRALAGYWVIAERLKSKYGPSTLGRFMAELSRAAATIYVGTNLVAMTTYTKKLIQDLRNRFESANKESISKLCAGYSTLLKDLEAGIQNLTALENYIYGQMDRDTKDALSALKEALDRNTGLMNLEKTEGKAHKNNPGKK